MIRSDGLVLWFVLVGLSVVFVAVTFAAVPFAAFFYVLGCRVRVLRAA